MVPEGFEVGHSYLDKGRYPSEEKGFSVSFGREGEPFHPVKIGFKVDLLVIIIIVSNPILSIQCLCKSLYSF